MNNSINLIDFQIGDVVIKIPRIENKIEINDRNHKIVFLINKLQVFCENLSDSSKIDVFKFYLADDAKRQANRILRSQNNIDSKKFFKQYLENFCGDGIKPMYNNELIELNLNSKNGYLGIVIELNISYLKIFLKNNFCV